MTLHATDAEFDAAVLQSTGTVLVDFWAQWCGPCRQLSPVLDTLAEEMKDSLKVVKVNIDENPETPQKYGVRGIPTLLLFKDGQLIGTKVGAHPKQKIVEWLRSVA